MADALDSDLDSLDEAVTQFVTLALERMESPEVAMVALLSAAERLSRDSGTPADVIEDIFRLLHCR